MNRLQALRTFRRVAQLRDFAAAVRELVMDRSVIQPHVAPRSRRW
jgi:hypothetical protein